MSSELHCEEAGKGDLLQALARARDATRDRFVVLERAPQFFMQCLCIGQGSWLVEKRTGSDDQHFRALVKEESSAEADIIRKILAEAGQPRAYLDDAQVEAAMTSFLLGEPEPDWLCWERIEV